MCLNLWTLLTNELKDKSLHNCTFSVSHQVYSILVYPTMVGEKFHFYSIQISSPPFGILWSPFGPPCRTTPNKFAKKSLPLHEKLILERNSPILLREGGGEEFALHGNLFPFLKHLSLSLKQINPCGTHHYLSCKTTKPLYFSKSYSMVINFQTGKPKLQNHIAKNIWLRDLSSLISNKAPNLYSVICSEMNTVSVTSTTL